MTTDAIRHAAALVQQADGLLIAAGAGMGVDSGLPDFRGNQGFWKAYPALARAKLQFQDIACPQAFMTTPELAWGFYGHRLSLYRSTAPHQGFEILRKIGERLEHGSFIFTSNVDGQFQKAGFSGDRIQECHGTIHLLQCIEPCSPSLWEARFEPVVDAESCRLLSPLPACPHCGSLARPNILMFGDWSWQEQRERNQGQRLKEWWQAVERPVIIELGAGTHIPSVRVFSDRQARKGAVIRINPDDPQIPAGLNGVSIRSGALAAMMAIDAALQDAEFWERES